MSSTRLRTRNRARYRARYRRIVFFFARILISLAIWDLILPRLGFTRWSQRNRSKRLSRTAAHFRLLAVQMGGVLIKVGQFLSARVDVLPSEITEELAGLQDEVPAENIVDIRKVVESEFGLPLEQKFKTFDPLPIAAASLGQVHQAWIGDSQSVVVVVKVQRPDIEDVIATDLAALTTVGRWISHYRPISRRANVPALIGEFTRVLYEEIDYLAEGRNAETFAANFSQRPGVRVPEVIWTHTTKRVLTLEDVRGIKITDYEAISAAGIDRAEVANRLFQTYLQQIFEDGFFHADPHPGNLFVSPVELSSEEAGTAAVEKGWLLTFVDFGMAGHMSPDFKAGMREAVIAVGTRDTARLVKSSQMLGILLPGADIELLEKAEAAVFDRFWGKDMSELLDTSPQEMIQFAHEFRQLIFSLPFQVPEDLILVGRCVGILSGLCTGLNPNFNVWDGLAPFAQKLIMEEATSRSSLWMQELGSLARMLLSYPRRVDNILGRLERGELTVIDPQLTRQIRLLEQAVLRAAGSLIFAALLLVGAQLYIAGEIVFGILLVGTAGLTLIWVLFPRRVD